MIADDASHQHGHRHAALKVAGHEHAKIGDVPPSMLALGAGARVLRLLGPLALLWLGVAWALGYFG